MLIFTTSNFYPCFYLENMGKSIKIPDCHKNVNPLNSSHIPSYMRTLIGDPSEYRKNSDLGNFMRNWINLKDY